MVLLSWPDASQATVLNGQQCPGVMVLLSGPDASQATVLSGQQCPHSAGASCPPRRELSHHWCDPWLEADSDAGGVRWPCSIAEGSWSSWSWDLGMRPRAAPPELSDLLSEPEVLIAE